MQAIIFLKNEHVAGFRSESEQYYYLLKIYSQHINFLNITVQKPGREGGYDHRLGDPAMKFPSNHENFLMSNLVSMLHACVIVFSTNVKRSFHVS